MSKQKAILKKCLTKQNDTSKDKIKGMKKLKFNLGSKRSLEDNIHLREIMNGEPENWKKFK